MNERVYNIGQRETLRATKKRIEAEIESTRESLRMATPITVEPYELDGDYILSLALRLKELLDEWGGIRRKITILTKEIGN